MSVELSSAPDQDYRHSKAYIDPLVRDLQNLGFAEPSCNPNSSLQDLVFYLVEIGMFRAVDHKPPHNTSIETSLGQTIEQWLKETKDKNPFRFSDIFHVCPEAEVNFLKNLSYVTKTDKYPPIIIHHKDEPIGLMKMTGEPTVYVFKRNAKHKLFPNTIGSSLPISKLARRLDYKRITETNSNTPIDFGKVIRDKLPMVNGVYTMSLDEISDPSRGRKINTHRLSTFNLPLGALMELDLISGYYDNVPADFEQCPSHLYLTCKKLLALETNEVMIDGKSGYLKLASDKTEPTIIV